MIGNDYLFLLQFLVLLNSLFATSLSSFDFNKAELDPIYWNKLSESQIRRSLKEKIIHKKAKNVILFIGDGMSIATVTASRILKGQLLQKSGEESLLNFEDFPHLSLIKTYNVDRQVPDSAGTATAFLCGVKANYYTLGVNARISMNETNCDLVNQNKVTSILQWAIESGKSAGIVTTTRITHATPGAAFAHIPHRDWEGTVPSSAQGDCKDIARQLIEDEPGSKLKVILGGGRRYLLPKTTQDFSRKKYGQREDNRNLIEEWIERKRKSGLKEGSFEFINNTAQLRNIHLNKIEYLFGAFNWSNMAYDLERDKSDNGEPSLEEMTDAAIKILKKDNNGFVLLVEGGRIDHAHHDNLAAMSLYETLAFEKAIQKSLQLLPKDDTLLIVTADHSHSLTINGYPKRGNSIFGIADNDSNLKPFTTLLYGNGPGYVNPRTDPSTVDLTNVRYVPQSAVHLYESNHGGEDVALYSTGPMSYLFQRTQEQSFVAHVIGFASCIGKYTNEDHCHSTSSTTSLPKINYFIPLLFLIMYYKFNRD